MFHINVCSHSILYKIGYMADGEGNNMRLCWVNVLKMWDFGDCFSLICEILLPMLLLANPELLTFLLLKKKFSVEEHYIFLPVIALFFECCDSVIFHNFMFLVFHTVFYCIYLPFSLPEHKSINIFFIWHFSCVCF